MGARRLRLAPLLACLALALAFPAAAEGGAADPRVDRADALLADASGYEEAIALYRAALAERPGDGEVRLRLARVLAWSERYGESLAELDRLVAMDAPPPTARVERAEVLSWAGRTAEAEREFEALLAADPDDARAARGLARVQSWSGRPGHAERSYARALALEPDSEAEQEYRRLRAGRRPWLRPGVGYVVDEDDFEWLRGEAETGFHRTATTTLRARVGQHYVHHPQRDVVPEARASRSVDRGTELALGIERRFEPAGLAAPLRVDLEAGARLWQHADETPLARGRVEVTPWPATVLGVDARTGDHLDESASFEALQERLRASGGGVWLWRGLAPAWELWARYDQIWISDENRRHAADATLSFRPFASRETRLHLGGGWMRYAHRSPFYYDPSSDIGFLVSATDRLALAPGLTLSPRAGIGAGAAHDGERGSGLHFEVAGELAYQRGDWHLALSGGHLQSQRRSRYTYEHVQLRITREFGAR